MEVHNASGFRTFDLKTCLHLFIISIIGFIAYSNTFEVPFVLDDIIQIKDNPVIRNLDNFLLALKGDDFGPGSYQYVPSRSVGYLSFALNYHFGGLSVTGYHVVNLLIHLFNGIMVYFLVVLTFRTPYFRGQQSAISYQPAGDSRSVDSSPFTIHDSRFTSFIALFSALLFVSHPVQTQAVTYIVQRFASLAALFYLLSVVLYIKGRLLAEKARGEGQEARGDVSSVPIAHRLSPIAFYFLSLLSAVLAMKTKEIAFTLPLVIILYETVFFTAPLKKKLLFLLPVALTLIIVPLSVMHSGKPLGEILSDLNEKTRVQTQMSRGDYLMTEMRVITTYVRLLLLPINQNLDYDYPIERSFFTPQVFLSFLFLAALFAAAVYLLYKSRTSTAQADKLTSHLSRLTAFGILWFFITLSVESSVIPIVDVIFEHRLYLPSIGFLIAIVAGLVNAMNRLKKEKSIIPLLVLITLALSVATYARNSVWADGTSLWEDVVRKNPGKARPHNNLAEIYYTQGHVDEAMRELQTALRLNPDFADAHNNLGIAYNQKGLLDEAIREFQAVLKLEPDYADAHFNLGIVYDQQGRLDEAIREFQAVLRLDPDRADAYNNLGIAYGRQGRLDEAMREFQTALRLNPDHANAHNNLGLIYTQKGRLDEAMREFQTVLRLNPDHADAIENLEALNKQMRSK